MDALLLPSRSTGPAITGHRVFCATSRTQGRSDRVSLGSLSSRVRSNLFASLKVADLQQLKSGKGKRVLSVKAKLATDEEVEDVSPTKSVNDDAIAQSVELLKTATKTRKVSALEIREALGVLEKGNIDPTNFPSAIGGTKSPGRTWLLVFVSPKEDYKSNEGKGYYFPITAVQRFDGEAMTIENGVFLGPLGELTFAGNIAWEKRRLSFIFHTLNLKIGPLGPFHFGIGSKDKEITKTDPFFIWYYADDEIIVGKGRAGGTSYWVRCSRVPKSLKEFVY